MIASHTLDTSTQATRKLGEHIGTRHDSSAADALAHRLALPNSMRGFFAASVERGEPAHRTGQRHSWLPMERGRPLLSPTAASRRSSTQPSTGSDVEKKAEHRLLRWVSPPGAVRRGG